MPKKKAEALNKGTHFETNPLSYRKKLEKIKKKKKKEKKQELEKK